MVGRRLPQPEVVTIYTDGGARGNPGPAAIGIVVSDADDVVLCEHKEHVGDATNNQAEYLALIKGLDIAAGYCRKDVRCVSDSELVVRQMTGAYRLKSPRMKELFDQVKDKERMFRTVSYRHRRRLTGRLARADELVNEALDEAGF